VVSLRFEGKDTASLCHVSGLAVCVMYCGNCRDILSNTFHVNNNKM
jgi:hypothetical protein